MADVIVRDIPRELRNLYKAALAVQDKTMKQDIVEHMKQTIEKANKKK